MISDKMRNALNNQIKNEIYSAYLYKSMGLHFKAESLNGFAAWMAAQAKEEEFHAQKLIDFVINRGGRVELEQIDKPKSKWSSPLEAFKEALEHEKFVTSEIHNLVKLADEENDLPSHYMLGWFVDEQVEEEATAGEIVDKLELVGDKPTALFMYDSVLGRRGASGGEE